MVGPAASPLSAAFLAGAAFLGQGGDLAAGQGIAEAAGAIRRASATYGGCYGPGPFAAVSGGRSRYGSGSDADVSGLSLMAGLSWGYDLDAGTLTLGAFVEHGSGSFATRNSFPDAGTVSGDGTVSYTGGGVLARMDFAGAGAGTFHSEASFRAGRVRSEYSSDFAPAGGPGRTGYESSSGYFGLHLGVGYLMELSENASLDVYARYFWTRRQGDSVVISTGDRVEFMDSDSHRVRAGGRLSFRATDLFVPYVGAAYELETDGRQRAMAYGNEIESPSVKGGTAVGELGVALVPGQDQPVSLELGLQGHAGTRDGWTGSFLMTVAF
ncbi:MAG: autotransporter outer membrane beta-barrel domain-containing protein [Deltaproteobacteria bacterium]|nr:autotransporter outer membrane beta-barrel domain-containing protein [Deltaproteobacteria bacterium]